MAFVSLLSFNNYSNRIFKKFTYPSEYLENSQVYITLSDFNFNPGDGVTTEVVVGQGSGSFLN